MGHGHHHHHHSTEGNLLFAFALNAGFSIIEFIGGYLTNSVAVTSDALHDLGDSIALLFAYLSERLSKKNPDSVYTYGYRRFSVLSALINALILLFGSSYVIYEAVGRINNPEPVHPEGMLLMGFLGVIVNGLAAYKLSKGEGLNQKMVMFHLLEDLLGWGAVIVVSVVLLFYPWYALDSILSILIALIILKGVYHNFIKVGSILLQKFPDELVVEEIVQQLNEIDGIIDVHAIRGWSIDDMNYSVSLHVVVASGTIIEELDEMKVKIKTSLENKRVRYSSIEFESEKFNC